MKEEEAQTVDIMEFDTIEDDDDYKKHYEVKDEQNNKTR